MSDEKGSHCVWLQGLPPRDLVFPALVRQSTTGIDKDRRRTDKTNLLFLGYLARLEAYEMECSDCQAVVPSVAMITSK